jgi:hypothetical protein
MATSFFYSSCLYFYLYERRALMSGVNFVFFKLKIHKLKTSFPFYQSTKSKILVNINYKATPIQMQNQNLLTSVVICIVH